MENEAVAKVQKASIGINKVTGAIQFSVPQGTRLEDAIRGLATVDLSELARLPRGCQRCISGHPFDIRELYDPVINVKLGHGG